MGCCITLLIFHPNCPLKALLHNISTLHAARHTREQPCFLWNLSICGPSPYFFLTSFDQIVPWLVIVLITCFGINPWWKGLSFLNTKTTLNLISKDSIPRHSMHTSSHPIMAPEKESEVSLQVLKHCLQYPRTYIKYIGTEWRTTNWDGKIIKKELKLEILSLISI